MMEKNTNRSMENKEYKWGVIGWQELGTGGEIDGDRGRAIEEEVEEYEEEKKRKSV